MPGDLSGGHYPMTYPFAKALGMPEASWQSNMTPRSNAEYLGLGNLTDAALAGTEVGCVVPVPVEQGDNIKKVSILIGATKGKKVEAAFAALYAPVNAKKEAKEQLLLGQSKSAALKETVIAEEQLTLTLESPVLIGPEIAAYGFVYVVIAMEAETMPTVTTSATPKATQAAFPKLFPNAPVAFSGTVGSGLKTKAEATLGAVTSKAVAPLVVLS